MFQIHIAQELGKKPSSSYFCTFNFIIIKLKFVLTVIVSLGCILNLGAQVDTIWCRSAVLQQVDTNKTVGLVLGIIEKDETYIFNFGRIDKKNEIMPDSNTVFEIGGVAKIFTAALLAQLQQQKYLSYKDTVFIDKAGKAILLSDLLTHHSGLPNLPPMYAEHAVDGFLQHDNYNYNDVEDDIKSIVSKGNDYLFSQLNYAIIGNYIQRKMNKKFEDLIADNIINKYNFAKTSFEKNKLFTNALPYDLKGDITLFSQPKAMNAALGLRSSMNDMLSFCSILIKEKNYLYKDLFEIRNTTNNKNMKSCYGFHAGKFNKKDAWFYIAKGRTAGFYSFILINPENHFSVCILANGSTPLDELAYMINDKLKHK